MNYKKLNIDDKLLEEIISVAYGDASFLTKRKVMKLAEKEIEIKNLLDEYQQAAVEVHSIQPNECPADIVSGVFNKTGNNKKAKRNIVLDLFMIYFRRPAASAFAAAVLVLAIVTSIIFENNSNQISHEELLQADRQVRQSLAIVSKIFKRSEILIQNQVFSTRVGQPLQKGVEEISNLFNSEKKNEKHN